MDLMTIKWSRRFALFTLITGEDEKDKHNELHLVSSMGTAQ
jgi:hypothetical protein